MAGKTKRQRQRAFSRKRAAKRSLLKKERQVKKVELEFKRKKFQIKAKLKKI